MKRIFLFLLAAGVIAFAACNEKVKVASASDKDSTSKMEPTAVTKTQQNKETVISAIDAVNRHDVQALFENTAPNYLEYSDGSSKPIAIDSAKSVFTEWFRTFPDFKIDNARYLADGEWVIVWSDCSGTWKGDFMNQKATGKKFKINDADFYRFNNEGKIIEHHSIQSFDNIWKQIGMKM